MPPEPQTEPKNREIPLFVSILILLCCLGAGGWFVWWYFHSPADKVVAVLEAPPQAARPGRPARGPRQWANRPFTEGVRAVRPTRWLVRADNILLVVDEPKGGESGFSMYVANVLSAPQREVVRIRQDVLDDPPTAKAMGLSAEQVKTLRDLSPGGGLQLEAADLRVLQLTQRQAKALEAGTITFQVPLAPGEQQTLRDDFNRYRAARGRAPRQQAEAALVAAVRLVAGKHKDQVEQMQQHELAALGALIGPEQIKQFHEAQRQKRLAATRPQTPTSRATTHPATH